MNKKTVLYFIFAFLFFILPLFIGNLTLEHSKKALHKIEKKQVVLTQTADRLDYLIKNHHALILQSLLMPLEYDHDLLASRASIQDIMQKLVSFAHASDKEKLKRTVAILKRRVIAYNAVELTLLEAKASNDKIDIEDALIGYNSITEQFLKDVKVVKAIAHKCLANTIKSVEETNFQAQVLVLFSFIFAIIITLMGLRKITQLKKDIETQLQRTLKAEKSLEEYALTLQEKVKEKTIEARFRYYHNALTQLPNRMQLLEDMESKDYHCIAMFNLDKFQEFNDLFGEKLGNKALKQTAKFLDENKYKNYVLYHLGGDEYVIAAPEVLKEVFIESIRRILTQLNSMRFYDGEEPYTILCSVGISVGEERLLACADIALKEAKQSGVGWMFYSDALAIEQSYKENIKCSKLLVDAIDHEQIKPYFQPIAQFNNGEIEKYEALVRIVPNEGHVIAPFRFLSIAKRLRVYNKITEIMFYETLKTIKEHNIACSMNLSADDLNHQPTVELIYHALEIFEKNAQLTFEILESEAIDSYESVTLFIKNVRALGVNVALDDFGSGYSNFSHVLNMPINIIKIDASLISSIDTNKNSRLMVETIVALAQRLKVQTVAEFVSSEAIYHVVKEIGVDYVQGYYIGKPEPIEFYM
ncbi:MAG: EAL domain-containing protein [Campylobacterota bacterium]|nr:EAL domain-containing protein [Campylobacterota bacterium]